MHRLTFAALALVGPQPKSGHLAARRAKHDDEALAVVEKHVPEQLKTYAKMATTSTGKR